MSYAFTVEVVEGKPTLVGTSGTLPDGRFDVSGHRPDDSHSLAVTFRQPGETKPELNASGYRTR